MSQKLVWIALVLGFTAAGRAEAEGEEWTFKSNAEKWIVWGTRPGGEEMVFDPKQRTQLREFVSWDPGESSDSRGSLKLADTLEAINCYAISPRFSIDHTKRYRFTGYFKTDTGTIPCFFVFFEDGEGKVLGSAVPPAVKGVVIRFERHDARDVGEGWSEFSLDVPEASISEGTVQAQVCVRPSGLKDPAGFIGTVWLSELKFKEH